VDVGLEVAGLMLGLAAEDFVAPEPQAAVAASPKPSRPSTARGRCRSRPTTAAAAAVFR